MNNDGELAKLLDLLKANPRYIRDIVFHSVNVAQVLGNAPYSGPSGSVSATEFLQYIKTPDDGHPIAFCGGGTETLYAKGTKVWVARQGMRVRRNKKVRKIKRKTRSTLKRP